MALQWQMKGTSAAHAIVSQPHAPHFLHTTLSLGDFYWNIRLSGSTIAWTPQDWNSWWLCCTYPSGLTAATCHRLITLVS